MFLKDYAMKFQELLGICRLKHSLENRTAFYQISLGLEWFFMIAFWEKGHSFLQMNRKEIMKQIMRERVSIQKKPGSEDITQDCADFIDGLLMKNP